MIPSSISNYTMNLLHYVLVAVIMEVYREKEGEVRPTIHIHAHYIPTDYAGLKEDKGG